MKLADKVAIVTGGASGIGKAIVKRFFDEGARVVVADRDAAAAEALAKSLGAGSFSVDLDVTKQESIELLVAVVAERAGGIDVLVNCAAIYELTPITEVSRGQWSALFSTNVDLRIVPGLIFVIGVVGIVLFFLYLDYSVRRDQKKSLEKLASLTCLNCGAAFGREGAEAAKVAGEKRIAEMMEDAHKRGVRLLWRIVMIWLPVCSRCGSRFTFRPDNERLLPETR